MYVGDVNYEISSKNYFWTTVPGVCKINTILVMQWKIYLLQIMYLTSYYKSKMCINKRDLDIILTFKLSVYMQINWNVYEWITEMSRFWQNHCHDMQIYLLKTKLYLISLEMQTLD